MMEVVLIAVFVFLATWFFWLRAMLRARGFNSSGADFFQAFMKDFCVSLELAKKGDKCIKLILSIMIICFLIYSIGFVFLLRNP
jgi:hypothetical protein